MILPDVNVLIHAHNSDSPVHDRARAWWDGCLAGTEGVGLAIVTILGFIRISTHPRILENPLPVRDVTRRIASWLEFPHFHIAHPSDRHFEHLQTALDTLGTAGNLTTDAHLAVLARERGYVLYTTDSDFARFENLRLQNPCRK
jgi:toxin-antitoxin system PIN domain toxin